MPEKFPDGGLRKSRVAIDKETGEHWRTDTEPRMHGAYQKLLTVLRKHGEERNYKFSPSYLAFNLNLEEGAEIDEFVAMRVPGITKDDENNYVVGDPKALENFLLEHLGRNPVPEEPEEEDEEKEEGTGAEEGQAESQKDTDEDTGV